MEKRKVSDCRKMPGSTCTVTIAGTEEEVMPLTVHHMMVTHGMQDTPELHKMIRDGLMDE